MSKKTKKRLLFSLRSKFCVKKNKTVMPKELAKSSTLDYVLTNQEEMEMLSRYILDYKNNETGGQLFGYWTFDGKLYS